MNKLCCAFFCLCVLFSAGCKTTKPTTITGDPMPPKNVIDMASDTVSLVEGGYYLGIESLEYIGDKFEETTEFLGDVYQSL